VNYFIQMYRFDKILDTERIATIRDTALSQTESLIPRGYNNRKFVFVAEKVRGGLSFFFLSLSFLDFSKRTKTRNTK
jgi:hypothetical protein